MSSPALAASKRADARLAKLIPKLVETRREMARLQAEEARLLAEARRIADDWAAEEEPGSRGARASSRTVPSRPRSPPHGG